MDKPNTISTGKRIILAAGLCGFLTCIMGLFPQIRTMIIHLTETYIMRRGLNTEMWMKELLRIAIQIGVISLAAIWSFFISEKSRMLQPQRSVLLCIFGVSFTAALIGIFALVWYPYQHEFREGAALVVTNNFLAGINPYSFDTQPQHTFVYGFLYPLIAIPINFLFGLDIVNFRVMNILFTLIAACVVYRFSVSFIAQKYLRIVLSASLFIGFAERGVYAFPNALGILLVILSVLLPYRYSFKTPALITGTVCSLLGFYSKPYFLAGILYISVILFLCISKKRAIIYFTYSMLAWAVSLFAVNMIFPVYLNNNLFHHMAAASFSFSHMIKQTTHFIFREFLPLALVYIANYAYLKEKKTADTSSTGKRSLKEMIGKFDAPFIGIDWKKNAFELCMIISLFLFVFKLGGHTGAGDAAYLYDLLYPFIFLACIVKAEYLSRTASKATVCLLLFTFSLVSHTLFLAEKASSLAVYKKDAEKIERELTGMKAVLGIPDVVSMLMKEGIAVTDSGQSEFFITGNTKYGQLVYDDKISTIEKQYLETIERNVRDKMYDLVMTNSASTGYGIPKDLSDYYTYDKSLLYPGLLNGYPTLFDGGNILIWTPKK